MSSIYYSHVVSPVIVCPHTYIILHHEVSLKIWHVNQCEEQIPMTSLGASLGGLKAHVTSQAPDQIVYNPSRLLVLLTEYTVSKQIVQRSNTPFVLSLLLLLLLPGLSLRCVTIDFTNLAAVMGANTPGPISALIRCKKITLRIRPRNFAPSAP